MPEAAVSFSKHSPVSSSPRDGRRTTSDSHLEYN